MNTFSKQTWIDMRSIQLSWIDLSAGELVPECYSYIALKLMLQRRLLTSIFNCKRTLQRKWMRVQSLVYTSDISISTRSIRKQLKHDLSDLELVNTKQRECFFVSSFLESYSLSNYNCKVIMLNTVQRSTF